MKAHILFILFLSLFFCCCTNRSEKALAMYEEGKRLEELGLPDSALISYRKVCELLNNSGNDSLQGKVYNQIGNLMYSNTLSIDAFEFYQKALTFNLKMDDKTEASRSLRGMGKSVTITDLIDSAIVYFNKALLLSSQIANRDEVALVHNNLSVAYFELQQYDSSLFHNVKSLDLPQDSILFYKNNFIRGNLFKQFRQYDSALICYNIGCKSTEIYTRAGCYYNLVDLAKLMNSGDSAKYLQTYHFLKDSIERANKSSNILIKDKSYQVDMAKRDEKVKYAYWIFSILIVSSVLTIVLVKRHRKEKLKSDELDKTVQKLYSEMSQLKAELSDAITKKEIHQEKVLSDKINKMLKQVTSKMIKCGEMSVSRFQETDSYAELNGKLKSDSQLSGKEVTLYRKKITEMFGSYNFFLKLFLDFSADDCYYCCLSLLKFKTSECAVCRKVSEEAIRSQKYRIKIKVFEVFKEDMVFNSIFSKIK